MKLIKNTLVIFIILNICTFAQEEIIINNFKENDQREPVIAKISNQNDIAIVWRSDNQVDSISEGDIYLRILSSNFNFIENEILVNQITNGNQKNPQIASNANGKFVIVWSSYDRSNEENFYDIKAKLYSGSTSISSNEILVNTFLQNSQTRPQVAMSNEGKFIVVWESWFQDGSERGIYAQMFDEFGNKNGVEFLVNSTTAFSQARPAIKYFNDDRFIISWESWNESEKGYNIFSKIFDPNGNVLKEEFMVNSYTDNYQWFSDIAVYSNNFFDIVWCSWEQDGYDGGIYLRSFNDKYQAISEEILINSSTEFYQWLPKIQKFENDKKAIIWSSWNIDGSREGVYYKILSEQNKPITLEARMNVNTESFQWEPNLIPLSNGEFAAVWSSWGEYSTNYEIVARKLIPNYLIGLLNSNNFKHTSGISTTNFLVHVIDSTKLNGHEYEIFFEPFNEKYLQFNVKDLTSNEIKISEFPLNLGKNVAYLTEEFDGIVVEIKPQFQLKLDFEKSYFVNNSGTNLQFSIEDPVYYPKIAPIDVMIIWGSTDTLANGNYVTPIDTALSTNIVKEIELPFFARNISSGIKLGALVFEDPNLINKKWDAGELILFFAPQEYQENEFDAHFQLQTYFNNQTKVMPNIGDTNFIFTQRPVTTEDIFRFTTNRSDFISDVKQTIIHNHFVLYQNYPNPFNPSTKIKYSLPNDANSNFHKVSITVFDILGRKVETLVNQYQKPGNYEITFNASKYASGIYFYKLETQNFQIVRKMILLR